MEWTESQWQAINRRGNNILVAAAAGSGKTAVLVERIVNKIIKDKIDIDRLLVVTFTNAAASEMREKILSRLYEKIEESSNNKYLQKQILLINKANISTIHAFCLEVIKNYFYEIDISPNFRLGDSSEIEILKEEALEEVFDKLYEEKNQDFIKLINTYCSYRGDEELKSLILKIYNYSQSNPFPEEWINESIEKFNLVEDLEKDFSSNEWGKIIISYFKEEIKNCINILKQIALEIRKESELEKYLNVISSDIYALEKFLELDKWDEIYERINQKIFINWPIDRKIVSEIKDWSKEQRGSVRKRVKDIKDTLFSYNSYCANSDVFEMYDILKTLKGVIELFNIKYTELKKEKNIIDFNDIEHYALKILVKKDENKKYIATDIAKQYQDKFKEIAVDEYQDSNLVQEYILTTISRNNNIFMVGDVKQSIYKFRQARPEMFLQKYDNYKAAENDNICKVNTKIQLFQNFRSRKNVLDVTNLIFGNIMSKNLGDIEYNESEYLNLGSNYPQTKAVLVGGKAELDIINIKKEFNEEVEEDEKVVLEKNEVEAKFVANRIQKLFNDGYMVWDKTLGYRKVKYRDIVILLRSTSKIANVYEKELSKLELPVFTDVTNNYFETIEVETIMSLLKIIDNPDNDIPLVTVLRSAICSFTDNELLEIKLSEKKPSFYTSLINAKENIKNLKIREKIEKFVLMLEDLQLKQEYLKLEELIWYIYESTGYYNYIQLLEDGDLRTANLKLLFEKARDYEKASFKGLYNFINYIEKLSKKNGDTDSAKLIGENEDVIRIMSIHKSKGLEFPVVFLCNTGKQFNMQDLTQSILIHQDLGFGPTYVNYGKKIEYSTLAKEAIKIKLKTEILSEEMRLLYVALTRSKEKLIITGIEKDLEKSLSDKQKKLEVEERKGKISQNFLKKSKSYLDWIEYVYLYNLDNINNVLDVCFINEVTDETLNKENFQRKELLKKDISEEIGKKLTWKYRKIENTKLEGKTSVSKISKEQKDIINSNKPKFMSKECKITGAEKGTLMHLVLQKIDFSIDYNKQQISGLIRELISKDIITEEQSRVIDEKVIYNFTQTELFKRIKNAEYIYKEKPFYINIPAGNIYNNNSNEKILVQGIIDLYFVEKNGNIVLIDYKTDYVENQSDLMNKYKRQLKIYKEALEKALNKKIEDIYIYSTFLSKQIKFEE